MKVRSKASRGSEPESARTILLLQDLMLHSRTRYWQLSTHHNQQTLQIWTVRKDGTNVSGDLHAEQVLRRRTGEVHGIGAAAIFQQERRAAVPLASNHGANLATFGLGAPDTDAAASVRSDGQR